VPNLRGRHDQEERKEQEPGELEACDVESTERRKKAEPKAVEPKAAEPSLEETDDCDSRLDGTDDSESGSRSERAEERRCDSETLNQPRPKRTRGTQRMRQRRDSKEAEKGRCRPGGSMPRKERTEQHVRGRPKDHTSNMQWEFREKVKTRRYGIPCHTKNRVLPKTRNYVWDGIPCLSEKHEIPCVSRKTLKIRKHGNPCDTENRVSWRKHGKPCELAKIRKSV
jgi:hypothetical protein